MRRLIDFLLSPFRHKNWFPDPGTGTMTRWKDGRLERRPMDNQDWVDARDWQTW